MLLLLIHYLTTIDTLMIHYCMLFSYVFIKCNMKERPEAHRSRRFRSPSGCRAKDGNDSGQVFAKTAVKMGFQDELKQEPPHISWKNLSKRGKCVRFRFIPVTTNKTVPEYGKVQRIWSAKSRFDS